MADHADALKSMLQDIINDRHEQASVTMHDYFVSKTREVAGLGQPVAEQPEFNDDAGIDDAGIDDTNDE